MINREFWKKVAKEWGKREEIEIPVIEDESPIPDEFLDDLGDLEDLDDWLKGIGDLDSDIDMSDFLI